MGKHENKLYGATYTRQEWSLILIALQNHADTFIDSPRHKISRMGRDYEDLAYSVRQLLGLSTTPAPTEESNLDWKV